MLNRGILGLVRLVREIDRSGIISLVDKKGSERDC